MYTISQALLFILTRNASRVHNVSYYFPVDRWTTSEAIHDLQISVAWATQLCRSKVRSIAQLQCTNLSSYFHADLKIPYQYCAGRKFKEDLQEALKESFPLFPLVDLTAEQRLIISKISAKRNFSGKE